MKKKSLIMLICAALVLTSVAFGTIAYLTSQDDVTNTFTMGNVQIKVDENEVDENGDKVTDDDGNDVRTEDGNDYRLIPGKVYAKDPTVTVLAGSEDCYARMLLTYNKAAELDAILPADAAGVKPVYFVKDLNTTDWTQDAAPIVDDVNNTITFVFYYTNANTGNVAEGGDADNVLPALFTEIEVPGTVTGEQLQTLNGLEINAKGQAIQTTTFEADEAAAWAAFDAQNTPVNP